MLDISKISYKVYLLRENGEQLNLTDIAESVTWEENEGELAMRVSLSLANILYNGKRISSIAKPNCQIIITAENAGKSTEVARAKITEWSPTMSGDSDTLTLEGYDQLYDLQASQDNRYISKGVTTQAAILSIFKDWGIPVGSYQGPTNKNAKTIYKNEFLSDIILDLLSNAKKHGARDCLVRSVNGKISVLPKAGNTTVYSFDEGQNVEAVNYKISTGEMVTVVKVVATESKSDRQAVEAIVKGKTEYGKRQRIYVRESDDTLADATAAAKQILADDGSPTETISVNVPDVPYVRRGDKIKLTSRYYTGYAVVASIQHDAVSRAMSMELTKYKESQTTTATTAMASTSAQTVTAKKKTYKVGDIVTFKGGYHYRTSNDSKPRGGLRTSGKAKITAIAKGAKHPWNLVGGAYNNLSGNCNVSGWVDDNTFS